MKTKIILTTIVLLAFINANAKHVKFSVDMSNQIVSNYGVFIVSDFQSLTGLGDDWTPNEAQLTKEEGTEIYSIVVDLPANAKYEYKFINGDSWYDVEFVPEESRVGYDYNDNRWIWVDENAPDTLIIGAIVFSGNAPQNYQLVRFRVDMQLSNISEEGIFVKINTETPQKMYSFDGNIYEKIEYLTTGNYNYIFLNGTVVENLPEQCATNSKRYINVTHDTMQQIICFNYCSDCSNVGLEEISNNSVSVFPNPSNQYLSILMNKNEKIFSIEIFNETGKLIFTKTNCLLTKIDIECKNWQKGTYLARIVSTNNELYYKKIFKH